MTAAEVAVLTQTLALLPPSRISAKTHKYFDTAVWTFFSSSPGQKSHVHADLFSSYILPTTWLPYCPHYQEDSLTHLMLITVFVFWLRSHWEFPNNKFFYTWNGLQAGPRTHADT